MVIVGTNQRAISFAQKIDAKPYLGYRILGFIDDKWQGLDNLKKHGFNRVSNLEGVPSFLRKQVVDEVIICLPLRSYYDDVQKNYCPM